MPEPDEFLWGLNLCCLQVTFKADELDSEISTVEELPMCVMAGEGFTIKVTLIDQFRNGLPGLEKQIDMVPDDPAYVGTVMKVCWLVRACVGLTELEKCIHAASTYLLTEGL